MNRLSRLRPRGAVWTAIALLLTAWLMAGRESGLSRVHGAEADKKPADRDKPAPKPPADNSLCYVCHLSLSKEELTTTHQAAGYGCTKCHGPSDDHMQDEMQMTTPDKLFGRRQVDALCGECHPKPHQELESKVKAFREQWRGKDRPGGRQITDTAICTDCHGTHTLRLDKLQKKQEQPAAEWQPVFNGRDLTDWKPMGEATWKVNRRQIIGSPSLKGAGDLWNPTEYEDYRVSVTFRAGGPVQAGIWLRATDSDSGPRVEIFARQNPPAYTGTVSMSGKGLVLANLRRDVFDPPGWNTMSVEVRGPRIKVWLNAEEIGSVYCSGPVRGRFGLHLAAGDPAHAAELSVREILIQELSGNADAK